MVVTLTVGFIHGFPVGTLMAKVTSPSSFRALMMEETAVCHRELPPQNRKKKKKKCLPRCRRSEEGKAERCLVDVTCTHALSEPDFIDDPFHISSSTGYI